MSSWYAIPSARPDGGTARLWHARGYKVALWLDPGADIPDYASIAMQDEYPGYAKAVNALCRSILRAHPEVEWIVTGGDDVEPDPERTPDQIAAECTDYFGGTFGVMQPTGDRWGEPEWVLSEHVAGSPWMGNEFCRRMYGGRGPLCEEYRHFYVDEDLQEVAMDLDVFAQRPDLTHFHHHWHRTGNREPAHLVEINKTFGAAGRLFRERKAAGFPGHEPLPTMNLVEACPKMAAALSEHKYDLPKQP